MKEKLKSIPRVAGTIAVVSILCFLGIQGCTATTWMYPDVPKKYEVVGEDGRTLSMTFLPSKRTIIHYENPANIESESALARMRGSFGTHYLGPIWRVEGPGVLLGLRWVPDGARPVIMETKYLRTVKIGTGEWTFPNPGKTTHAEFTFADNSLRFQGMWLSEVEPNNVEIEDLLTLLEADPGDLEFITGRVIGVTDGDTVTVLDQRNTERKIRLEGIDAPESDQAYGPESQEALASKVLDMDVFVEPAGKDKYGRTLGRIYIDGKWINKEMVEGGWAWHYKEYSNDAILAQAEVDARKAKVGLWADPQPVAPWDFRKGVLLDEPSDPNSKFEIFDRLNLPKYRRDLHQLDRRILPFIEKTPETKETNVHANENRNQISPGPLPVSEEEQDSRVAG